MRFSDTILDLFEEGGEVMLGERYKVCLDGWEANGVLCHVICYGKLVPRIEVVLVDESENMVILLDGGRATMTVTSDKFRSLMPFLLLAVSPL
jgi:predicted SpoU family rRNA methylase